MTHDTFATRINLTHSLLLPLPLAPPPLARVRYHKLFEATKTPTAAPGTAPKRSVTLPTPIGTYLSSTRAGRDDILSAYMKQIDFKKITFEKALRLLFTGFRLPKQKDAQDKLLLALASEYTFQNKVGGRWEVGSGRW